MKLLEGTKGNIEKHYTTQELANLGFSVHVLAKLRCKGLGPKYVKLGHNSILYPESEIKKYLEEKMRSSTSATCNYDLHPQKGQ